jgi:hypothetical protein
MKRTIPLLMILMFSILNGICQFRPDQLVTDPGKFGDAIRKLQLLNPIITDSGVSFINKVSDNDLDARNFVFYYFVKGYCLSPDSVRLDFNITTQYQNNSGLVSTDGNTGNIFYQWKSLKVANGNFDALRASLEKYFNVLTPRIGSAQRTTQNDEMLVIVDGWPNRTEVAYFLKKLNAQIVQLKINF